MTITVTRDPNSSFSSLRLGRRLERVFVRLQVEERRRAARPPFVLLHRRSRSTLAVADFGVPSPQPDSRIVARREEPKAQRSKALFIR